MRILICGAGAIGSNLTARLVSDLKGEHEITVLDKDTIEERNVQAGTQFYTRDQIGLTKVEALQFNVYKNYEREITIIHDDVLKTFHGRTINDLYDLIIDCFDNHEARDFLKQHVSPKGNLLHTGFSDDFTFAIEWNENYKVPSDIEGMDICEMPGAASFVNKVASMGALVAQEFIKEGKKLEIVGGKFTHSLIQ